MFEAKKAHQKSIPPPNTNVLSNFEKGVAPLEIKTSFRGVHYFIKFVRLNDKSKILTAFIRDGDTFYTSVPLGTFILKYACGKEWFGEQYLFGEGTSYFEAEEELNFKQEEDGYSGYKIELIMQPGGNLKVKHISASSF